MTKLPRLSIEISLTADVFCSVRYFASQVVCSLLACGGGEHYHQKDLREKLSRNSIRKARITCESYEVVHCCSEPLKQSGWQGTEPKEGFYICGRQRTSLKSREKKSRVLKCREDINGSEDIKVMLLLLTRDGQRREQQTFLHPILARMLND